MVVPLELPLKLICDVTRLWWNLVPRRKFSAYAPEQKQTYLVTIFLFFLSFHYPQLFYCSPCPTAAPASLDMHVVSTNFAKTLVCKREYDVILWRHKQRTSNNNDQYTPLLNTRIWKGGIQSSSRPGHHQTSARHCLPHWCCGVVLPDGVILHYFVKKWCNFTCLCVGKISCHTIEKFLHICVISSFLTQF